MNTKNNKSFSIENALESFIFNSRWILAVFYFVLAIALAELAIKFLQDFYHLTTDIFTMSEIDTLLGILGLVDMTMLANLLILVIFSGYENFVSVIGVAQDSPDRPKWMGEVDFAGLKLKLIGSIVALSGIYLLSAFLNIKSFTHEELAWMIGLHFTFVVTGVLFALSEKIAHK